MSDPTLHTQRLTLVPLSGVHAGVHTGDECFAAVEHWAAHGFGHWAILESASGTFVGVAEVHFAYPGVEGISTDEVEVGWTIVPDRQNQGFATEAMHAALADAFVRGRVAHVVAYIRPENGASIRVAAKLGFALRGPGRARSGDPVGVYELRLDA